MTAYVLRRFLFLLLMLCGLLLLTFVISHVAPGDPARVAAGPDASNDMVEIVRKQFGLDQPLSVQFGQYVKHVVTGDFGRSLRTRQDVADDLLRFFPNSFELVTLAIVLATVLGVTLGMLSAVYRDRWPDHLSRVLSVSGVAIPAFWLGLMLQLLIALDLGWLPLGGRLRLTTPPPAPITHL